MLCQAKSGMGKTAVFVLGVLHSIKVPGDPFQCIVLCPARELAIQIAKEFERMGKYLTGLRTQTILGGLPLDVQKLQIETNPPHIIIGTPGRTLDLLNKDIIKLDNVNYFILDECDKILENLGKFSFPTAANCRHARGHPEDLPEDEGQEAGDDVHCHAQ